MLCTISPRDPRVVALGFSLLAEVVLAYTLAHSTNLLDSSLDVVVHSKPLWDGYIGAEIRWISVTSKADFQIIFERLPKAISFSAASWPGEGVSITQDKDYILKPMDVENFDTKELFC